MAKTSSAAELLRVALQDLHAGKALQRERLPAIRDAATDPTLVTLLAAEVERVGRQADRLATTGLDTGGPTNLWMSGVLDDADRDAKSHAPGPLLDIALVGAVRKAKAAEIVSGETALALARMADAPAMRDAAAANRDEEIATDRALAERLAALTGAGA